MTHGVNIIVDEGTPRVETWGASPYSRALRAGAVLACAAALIWHEGAAGWCVAACAAFCTLAGVRPLPWATLVTLISSGLSFHFSYRMLALAGDTSGLFAPFRYRASDVEDMNYLTMLSLVKACTGGRQGVGLTTQAVNG